MESPTESGGATAANKLEFLNNLVSLLHPHTLQEQGPLLHPTKHCSTAADDVDDASQYLNSAELLLLKQRKQLTCSPDHRDKTCNPSAGKNKKYISASSSCTRQTKKASSDTHSRSRDKGLTSNYCWLKESKEKDIYDWLSKKEKESTSRRLEKRREKRLEKRRKEERVREKQEREVLAKEAYDQRRKLQKKRQKSRLEIYLC